ncbi:MULTISPECIES: 4Fe4S-binding leucine-rich repeat protein [Rhodopseudomonas]|uniref:4Fe4S-binding leucine-rich repeat protein n=1 Tax=Rhodopseudomonas TaxID=1073 RepID=UPI0005CB4567|nr:MULTISPECIES: 4Fe4S-binding leucine-rich repeat protein [Rhodopseudomonas]MDF3810976.1 4Fe4S-binding leucine-rich repeat protein [Rhodopseudomonas sp. BAL398]WOK15878.1 4Fe4S-binding leucine-rich repeat protein [Rhodopseudomonas sp. BAL398]
MTTDIDEAMDWRGEEVSCASCPHLALSAQGGCELKKACVQDRYARRIDRFFDWNRALADDYLAHPYFEVRAIAANYATVFLLPRMLDDPDETVRWCAARRLPKRYLLPLRSDPHREVRIRIATVLGDDELRPMFNDSDYYVRLVIARRVVPSMLPLLVLDPDVEVRREVARRIGAEWLAHLAMDEDAGVRLEAARRMSPGRLLGRIADPDWRVRYEVASRVDVAALGELLEDPDPVVRDLAWTRVAAETTDAVTHLNATPATETRP